MSGGVVYLLAKYADLTVNDQSQYILSILVIGAGTDYALLLVARYREELRRHEDRHEAMAFALHRATPRYPGQRGHGRHRPDVPRLRRPQLHGQPRPGARGRCRGDVPRHGHPAPRAAGHLRPLGVLAASAAFGSDEPTQTGLWARVGNRISIRPRVIWVGTAGGAAGRLPRPVQAGGERACPRRTPSPRSSTRSRPRSCSPSHDLFDNSNTVQVVADADTCRAVEEAVLQVDGLGDPKPTSVARRRSVLLRGADRRSTWRRRRPSTSSRTVATRRTASRGRKPWSAVARPSTWTPRRHRYATTRWSSRWCSSWCCSS